ncbi:MAG: MFS transporter, partial [Bacteroidota bacterium]|nr:MFS transporter [Bacteroidota bacterium]
LFSILYTIFTTSEYPPEDLDSFKEKNKSTRLFSEIWYNIIQMPRTMTKLGVVQFFSWFAFFTMWSMANPALTEHVYQAPAPIQVNYNISDELAMATFEKQNIAFQKASNLVGSKMGIYGLSSMAFALILTLYTSKRTIHRKFLHMGSLTIGGMGFLGMYFFPEPYLLGVCFACVGIAWGSILSMPYAMLSSSVDPEKMGITMGIFNMFIVFPQIFAALGGVIFFQELLGPEPIYAMVVAGISLLLSAIATLLITNKKAIRYQPI